jgi:C2H2 transcription facotor
MSSGHGGEAHTATRTRRGLSNATTSSSSSYSSATPLTPTSPLSPCSPAHGGSGTSGGHRRSRPGSSLPAPIPVPNLTKKSRGRRVPTAQSITLGTRRAAAVNTGEDLGMIMNGVGGGGMGMGGGGGGLQQGGGAKGARIHMCKVPGCGKCFARGEHLKRHVRSIHTYEKRKSLRFSLVRSIDLVCT